jgi:lactoylglutathione lyase
VSLKHIQSLDYLVLLCDDLAAMRKFYEGVLGFAVTLERTNWIEMRVGATLLTLRPRTPSEGFADGASVPDAASIQLAFRVPPSAIDDCHSELIAADAKIVRGPTNLPAWRHRTIFFRDPEGNLLEIYAEY